jgi:predicted ATPase
MLRVRATSVNQTNRTAVAIELAAARTISMGVPGLRDRLDDRFRLLAASRRGMERHRTSRHAVQWSYAGSTTTNALWLSRLDDASPARRS